MISSIISFILGFFKKKPALQQEMKPMSEDSDIPEIENKPYLITEIEILRDVKREDIPQDHQDNLVVLLERINKVRYAYSRPMKVSSGYRSMADHLRIYAAKGVTDESKIPMKSSHLKAAAADISDPKQELQKWCIDNVSKLEEIGLWCEAFTATPNWVHFQIFAPKSGNRFFNP